MTNAPNVSETGAANLEPSMSAAALDCAPVGVIVLDASQRIVAFNRLATRITGLPAESVLGRFSAALPAALQAVLDESFVTNHPISARPVAIAPGSPSLISVTTNIARSAEGDRLLSVTAELQDLVAAAAVSANLEHLDRLANLGVVTAGVAHEIKNALVAVRTLFDLQAAGQDDADLRNVAAGEIRRIEKVVRQLLRGARREEFHTVRLNLHALLEDALHLVRHEMHSRRVEVKTRLSATSDSVNADERQLRHTVMNLLINAAEAMPNGGTLTVESQTTELRGHPHVRLTFADTGCGIRSEDMPRLFSPFFSTKAEGTGLGLAISRRIVHAHNGAITVESREGEGTTFTVFLPLI